MSDGDINTEHNLSITIKPKGQGPKGKVSFFLALN